MDTSTYLTPEEFLDLVNFLETYFPICERVDWLSYMFYNESVQFIDLMHEYYDVANTHYRDLETDATNQIHLPIEPVMRMLGFNYDKGVIQWNIFVSFALQGKIDAHFRTVLSKVIKHSLKRFGDLFEPDSFKLRK